MPLLRTPLRRALITRGHRIVVPNAMVSGAGDANREDDRARKLPHSALTQLVGEAAGDELNSRVQLQHFRTALEQQSETIWRDSRSHLRKQEKLIAEYGVDGAIRESLLPSSPSFFKELMKRPLDRKIVEEIYLGLHGRRSERLLKRGVSWEHWITKGDGTAPVFNASKKAQQMFGYGGRIQRVASVRHESAFPASNHRQSTSTDPQTNKKKPLSRRSSHPSLPEIAFIGRTNSGKSSVINSLVNALVCPWGHLQGTTTSADFYSIANRLMFVDLPGYGYYNPLQTSQLDAENAIRVMKEYLKRCDPSHPSPRPVKRVFLCASSRGLQQMDYKYLDLLEEYRVPFSVLLTKTDVVPIRFLARLTDYTRCQLVRYKHCEELFLVSALRLAGIDKIQDVVANMALRTQGDPLPPEVDFSRLV